MLGIEEETEEATLVRENVLKLQAFFPGGYCSFFTRVLWHSECNWTGRVVGYQATADPLSPNSTGVRYFCSFEDGVVRSGSASLISGCPAAITSIWQSTWGRVQAEEAEEKSSASVFLGRMPPPTMLSMDIPSACGPLFGGAHLTASAFGVSAGETDFAWAAGGGLDAHLNSRYSVRLA